MATKPHPASLRFSVIATDIAVFTVWQEQLHVLLLPVDNEAFTGMFGLPGGLILPTETAEDSANRHLKDKAKINVSYLEQLFTFSAIKRDPRGRVVSVAYFALVPAFDSLPDIASDARWVPVNEVATLAYDHNEVLLTAITRLRTKLTYTNLAYNLVAKEFTLSELQSVYETVLETELDKRNFRKKLLQHDIVVGTGRKRTGEANRPAELYHFKTTTPTEVDML